jgi:hypothetical protein
MAKNMKKLALIVTILISLGTQSAIAQTTDMEEEQFDDAIEQFGYLSGNAFQCATSGEATVIEKQAMQSFTGISRLFGTDRAFFYSAAYGVGATAEIDKNKCSEYIRQFQETMDSNELK